MSPLYLSVQVTFCLWHDVPFWLQITSLTLDKQIMFFHRTVKHNLPKMFAENEKLEKHISESLFFVSTGVNDHFHNETFRGNKRFAFFLLSQFTLRIQVHISCDRKLAIRVCICTQRISIDNSIKTGKFLLFSCRECIA